MFFRRQFIIDNKIEYDSNLKISGDYEFLENLINSGASILYLPITICDFALGGISNQYNSFNDVLSHSKEIKKTRKLSLVQFVILTIKLCRKLRF